MDEVALKQIADNTQGMFFRAEDLSGLSRVYDTIDRLEKNEAMVKVYDHYRDLFDYLLGPAFCFLALFLILSHTRFLRVP